MHIHIVATHLSRVAAIQLPCTSRVLDEPSVILKSSVEEGKGRFCSQTFWEEEAQNLCEISQHLSQASGRFLHVSESLVFICIVKRDAAVLSP